MAFPLYLAMTAGELQNTEVLPPRLCYMACHFSAYTTGLSNIPEQLPPNSILILNDRMSIHGHDPDTIGAQLAQAVRELGAWAVLLDWERPPTDDACRIAQAIASSVPCPVAATTGYAPYTNGPVLLPALPINQPLHVHIEPWQHRQIWLEAGLDVQQFSVTESGCSNCCLAPWDTPEDGHADRSLHCHYRVEVSPELARFTLWRTQEDLRQLLAEAEGLGIACAVGLYQQLHNFVC